MNDWTGLRAVPADLGPSVVTIGVFDGVHRGHQVIVGRAVERAHADGLPCVVLTFDPHPLAVLRPELEPPYLLSLEDRIAELRAARVDGVCVLPFTQAVAELTPEEFAEQVLVEGLRASGVVVGANFRFGHGAAGDTSTLHDLGRQHGFWVETIGLSGDGETYSSTRVRELLGTGEVAEAALVLGRPHRLVGPVVHGNHRGRELGYPTANLGQATAAAVPADGVYAGWLVRAGGVRLPAAVSVGTNPTFDGVEQRVEAYVLDRTDLDLYGEQVALEFVERLRGTERFDSAEDLVAQMGRDVARARSLLDAGGPAGDVRGALPH